MGTILLVIVGQLIFAGIVILVLWKLLDRELMKAALEKFESCKASAEVKEIVVFSAGALSDEFKSHLDSVRQRKFVQASFDFRQNAELKGGVVIAFGDVFLDFSLSSRLQNFWS